MMKVYSLKNLLGRVFLCGIYILLNSGFLWAQTTPAIKTIRTTVYEPVLKDTVWSTGKVIDYILFIKYDSKGRKIVENQLKPDGSPNGKLVYLYDENGRVKREVYATAHSGVARCWDYSYDDRNRLIRVVSMDGKEDTIRVYTAAEKDTVSLRHVGVNYLSSMMVVKERTRDVVTVRDAFGNWIEKHNYKEGVTEPELIIRRDITYVGEETDWSKIPLRGQVKRVTHSSYVALPKGPQTIDKGKKEGNFFIYEFDKEGRKVREETFSDTGIPTGRIGYEYDEKGELSKESYYTTAGVLVKYIEHRYDEERQLKNSSIYDGKRELIQRDVYRYDIEGNRVKETGYRKDGSKYKEIRYMYDSYGQLLKREVLLSPEAEEPLFSFRRSWNFQKRITEEARVLLSGEEDFYTYRYNAKGEVVSGTEQCAGQPEVEFLYKFHNDKQGNWKIRIKYVEGVPTVYEERTYVYYN